MSRRKGPRSCVLAGLLAMGIGASLAGCGASPHERGAARTIAAPAVALASSSPLATPEIASTPATASLASTAPTPDEEGASFEALEVPEHGPAVLFVPAGRDPAPIVVVTHGAGDRPEPDCARYRALTGERAFVLCTRGRTINALVAPEERRFFYDGHPALGREVVAALGALAAKHPRAHLTDVTFAGYSQGASMGILYLQSGGAREVNVTRVLLVEGGSGTWNLAVARALHDAGVEKVAFVCGQVKCHDEADRAARWMRASGLLVRVDYAPGAGHTGEGSVRPLVEAAWAWLSPAP